MAVLGEDDTGVTRQGPHRLRLGNGGFIVADGERFGVLVAQHGCQQGNAYAPLAVPVF
ncbi:hypothetical protein D3C86_2212350 [compost metagenome]